ncbi:MAG: hypothetical protein R3211_08450 [Balneolaceae bacterium]|nr:hypothetical protein [Balneolaceae bacterium]
MKTGRWNGHLTPMHHPEMKNPVMFDVSYDIDNLEMTLTGPGGEPIQTRNERVKNDTLHFEFNEPEENVLLKCRLARTEKKSFNGKCTDPSGQWARFTMNSPN